MTPHTAYRKNLLSQPAVTGVAFHSWVPHLRYRNTTAFERQLEKVYLVRYLLIE
jgi:hypothetical protein